MDGWTDACMQALYVWVGVWTHACMHGQMYVCMHASLGCMGGCMDACMCVLCTCMYGACPNSDADNDAGGHGSYGHELLRRIQE